MRWWWLCGVALLACDDKEKVQAAEHLAKAKAQYRALVDAKVPPSSPKFDPVLQELKAVGENTPSSKDARTLEHAVLQARQRPPPPPLAHPEDDAMTEQERALSETCVQYAKALGTADGGMRAVLEAALKDCKAKGRALEEEAHPHGP
ncbi:MAG: hypothetical protein K1X89_23030 [Myxococcaceae bacterium]|nr:hypothetical protein [Myxococcaceae bacterium]